MHIDGYQFFLDPAFFCKPVLSEVDGIARNFLLVDDGA